MEIAEELGTWNSTSASWSFEKRTQRRINHFKCLSGFSTRFGHISCQGRLPRHQLPRVDYDILPLRKGNPSTWQLHPGRKNKGNRPCQCAFVGLVRCLFLTVRSIPADDKIASVTNDFPNSLMGIYIWKVILEDQYQSGFWKRLRKR